MLTAGKHSLLLICIFSFPQFTWSGNILFLVMPGALSHRRTLFPIAEALQERGHQVTTASVDLTQPILLSGKIEERFFIGETSDHELLEFVIYHNSTMMQDILWNFDMTNALTMVFPNHLINKICLETINVHREELKKFMEKDWDLILVDDLFNACGAAMASLSTAPHISYAATLVFPGIKFLKGVTHNPVITSPIFHKFEFQPENFWSRVQSILAYSAELFYTVVGSNFVTIQSGKFLDPQKYQSFSSFISSSEMLLTDYPDALDYPHPGQFDLVSTGSYCKSDPKPLPEHFERFVSDPKSKGTIYMAFGTIVDWNAAPMEKILVFKEAISSLKDYRIFWQYNGPKIELPEHVISQKWFPQADILADKRTVVFLSHGGLKSLREGICEGVPTVVMPVFSEQLRNALIVKEKKVGTFLDKMTLTADNIQSALRTVMEDAGMRRNMGKLRDFLQGSDSGWAPKGCVLGRFFAAPQGCAQTVFLQSEPTAVAVSVLCVGCYKCVSGFCRNIYFVTL